VIARRTDRRGEPAVRSFQEADKLDATPRLSHGDEVVYSLEAERARAKGEILLQPASPLAVSAGEVITAENQPAETFKGAHTRIIDSLPHPNMVTAGASADRMNAALGAGVLAPAIDAAMAVQARNSVEKMLCHQLAAAHYTAMRLIERSTQPNLQAGEVACFTNASARMMDVYQAGCLALLKRKTRGQQRVLVQYVNVGAGGQAVVAGRVDRGSRKRGRRRKTRDEPQAP
jgi:hypothetical protein